MPRASKTPCSVFVLCGRRGTGKTTKAKALVNELLSDGRDLVLVHDTAGQFVGQYWGSCDEFRRAPKLAGKVHCFHLETVGNVARLAVELGERRLRVVLVIDELDMACRGAMTYVDDKDGGYIRRIVHRGRHIGRPIGDPRPLYGVDLIGSARRPTNLCTDIPSLAGRFYFYAMIDQNSIDWIARTCNEQVAEQVSKLGLYQWVEFDPADTSDLRQNRAIRPPKSAP